MKNLKFCEAHDRSDRIVQESTGNVAYELFGELGMGQDNRIRSKCNQVTVAMRSMDGETDVSYRIVVILIRN